MEAQVDEFDRFIRHAVAVQAFVQAVELLRNGREPAPQHLGAAGHRHRYLGCLADVAQIEHVRQFTAVRGDPLGLEIGCRALCQRLHDRERLVRAHGRKRPQDGLDVVVGKIGSRDAACREQARMPRHDDAPDPEFKGNRGRVQGAAAAERHQGVVARVAAPLDRHGSDGFGDLACNDPEHAERRDRQIDPERRGDLASDDRLGAGTVQRHLAVGEGIRVDQAHQQIDVGDRRPVSTQPVAGGAGPRAHALRPDPDPSDLVDAHDAAAARADRMDIQHRDRDGKHVDLSRRRGFRDRTANEAGIQRRAAHVHGDEIAVAGTAADFRRADDGPCGPRQHGQRRIAHDDLRRGDAAARLEDVEGTVDALRRQPVEQAGNIGPEYRGDIGCEHRGGGSRKLAELAQDFARQHDIELGQGGAQAFSHLFLVHRVQEGEQETHRDAFDPFVGDRGNRRLQIREVEIGEHLATPVDTTGNADAQVTGHQRRRLVLVDAVDQVRRASEAADFKNVPEVPVGDQGGLRTLALKHRVGRDRRSVADPAQFAGGYIHFAQQAGNGLGNGPGAVIPPVQDLGDRDLATGIVDQDHIREGAADVYADAIAGFQMSGTGHDHSRLPEKPCDAIPRHIRIVDHTPVCGPPCPWNDGMPSRTVGSGVVERRACRQDAGLSRPRSQAGERYRAATYTA